MRSAEALAEMTQRRILAEMHPYDEKLTHASTKGRPKIVEAVWRLIHPANFPGSGWPRQNSLGHGTRLRRLPARSQRPVAEQCEHHLAFGPKTGPVVL
jgi:hypothetical protein